MKALTTTAAAAAMLVIGATAVASPHGHSHRHAHLHKKHAEPENKVVQVPGKPEVVYQFEGALITESEVCQGITNGTFVWADGTTDKPDCANLGQAPAAAAPVPDAASLKKADKQEPAPIKQKLQPHVPVGDASAASTDTKQPSAQGSAGGPGDSTELGGGDGDCDKEFEDGAHDCSDFPSQYGAMKIGWEKLGGWSGVQYTEVLNGIVGKIDTAVGDGSGGHCKPGAYCSYACPPGYQKSQWPEQKSGTSVGGLQCGKDGKLYRSNKNFKRICIKGTEKADVTNKLSKNVAICRTDYPGTESETIPLNTQPGKTYPLTCPDAKDYYAHQGASTSAQYYVNPAGTEVHKACTWGKDETGSGDAYGNWAPVNIGVGTNPEGATFISLLSTEQNYPDKVVPLNFNIEIKGDLGGSACMYKVENGQGKFCSSGTLSNPGKCQPHGQYKSGAGPVPGCTVQVFSGSATYVLSEA